jgi:DNA-binding CsgD family transcriptional regulator
MANIALGHVAEGEAQLRRAMDLARHHDDLDGVATAYSNLADLLSLAGRTREALEVAREGLDTTPSRLTRTRDWLSLTVAALAFDAGDWSAARAHLTASPSETAGVMFIFRQLVAAELAVGEGKHDSAAACLEAAEPLVRVSPEAQWHGLFGSLQAELRRRQGDLDGARAAVARALDELEVCTDDVMRIARVTAAGLSVEADRALRARDLHEPAEARETLARGRIHLQRLRAAAQDGGPVERAWHAVGAAELGRARGRSEPAAWAKAAEAWQALARPYLEASALWRQAEALVERGEREAAAARAAAALELARRLGAGWLVGELEALVARARLTSARAASDRADDPDGGHDGEPFGLTPRERQVLALVAAGATNRQIGASLYMAEKTASVHVSRILAKLGVQTRTQAAAVAHRLHLS